jgi:hypothetical protein
MAKMTPEQEAAYALDFGVARSDLPLGAQLAYDQLVEQRACAAPPAPAPSAPVSAAVVVDSVRLPETTSSVWDAGLAWALGVAGWHDRLYLAWADTSLRSFGKLVLAYSTDGREITDSVLMAQRGRRSAISPSLREGDPGPSLAVSGGHLYLAWTGTDGRVNILADPHSAHSAPARLKETRSSCAPALCSHQDRLYLAWTANDGRVNILADPHGPHGAPARLEDVRSIGAPALCSHQDRLILVWTGTRGYLNLARVQWPGGSRAT